MHTDLPVLYSFRRCPFAMRTRMAIAVSGYRVRLREVVLRDKPPEMLDASPKGTVPVLQLPDGHVIDESIEVMSYVLKCNDPDGWLAPADGSLFDMHALIRECDGPFKHHLDRFKYATRYENADPDLHRREAALFLGKLDEILASKPFLFGSTISLADVAIFPFIRQFAGAAGGWFRDGRFPHLQPWLDYLVETALFKDIMKKYPQWKAGDKEPVFPVMVDQKS